MPGELDPLGKNTVTASFFKACAAGNIGEAIAILEVAGASIGTRGGVSAVTGLLKAIHNKYPARAQQCKQCAQATAQTFRAVGKSPSIVEIRDKFGARYFFLADGKTKFGSDSTHQAVFCEGRMYNALTGPSGKTIQEYLEMLGRLNIVPVLNGLPSGVYP